MSEETDGGIFSERTQHAIATNLVAEGKQRGGPLELIVDDRGVRAIGKGAAGFDALLDLDIFFDWGLDWRRDWFRDRPGDGGPLGSRSVGGFRTWGQLQDQQKLGLRIDQYLIGG